MFKNTMNQGWYSKNGNSPSSVYVHATVFVPYCSCFSLTTLSTIDDIQKITNVF